MTTVVCPLLNQLTPRVYRRGPVVFYVPLHASNLLLFYSSRALIDVAIVVIYFIWTTKLDHGEDCNFFCSSFAGFCDIECTTFILSKQKMKPLMKPMNDVKYTIPGNFIISMDACFFRMHTV